MSCMSCSWSILEDSCCLILDDGLLVGCSGSIPMLLIPWFQASLFAMIACENDPKQVVYESMIA